MPLRIRPFTPADIPAVDNLHRGVDWPARSAAGWSWMAGNPARNRTPTGWIAEDGCGGCAFVGQFIQRFVHGEDEVTGLTGYSIIVPPAMRGAAPRLIRHLLDQEGPALHFTLNANQRAEPLYRKGRLKPWPEATHGLKLAWIVDPAAWAAGRILRGWPGLGDDGPERVWNRRLHEAPPLRLPPGVSVLDDLSDSGPAGRLWERLRGEDRVLADRSPATLRWRLSDPDRTSAPVFLVHTHGDEPTAWALAMMGKASRLEPPVLDIIDLVAIRGEDDALGALVGALLSNGRRMGAAKVRLQVVSPDMLQALGPLAKRARREGGWGHAFARFSPEWDGRLRAGWAPTPYDGDYSFCLRPPPADRLSGPTPEPGHPRPGAPTV